MKRYIIAILMLLPMATHAEIPAIVALGEEASRQEDVEHESVGSFMLGMASTFANKEQRATFKMLDNIEMIECKNEEYAPILRERTLAIINDIDAKHIATHDDGKALNELYGIYRDEVIEELIILIMGHEGGVAIVAMSGEIPENRLGEISNIKQ